ncbi:hypothetical protein I2486_12025, partial [Cellulophaga sp. E16_2]|uniref:beta strand repeat-containing protein n=1 Tax=Cellulophaga sp. E16_2 TaxID=2789297 RepID=UPI001A936A61
IVTDKLAADAVTNSKLADNAVQTENILSEGNDKVLVTNAAGIVEWIDKATLVPATTVSNTSTVNTLATTVDGVTGAGVAIINSNELSLDTNNELVSTINGEASTALDLEPAIVANQKTTSVIEGTGVNVTNTTTGNNTAYTVTVDPTDIIGDGTISSTDIVVSGGANSTLNDVTLEIADNAITNAKMADNAITTTEILDGTIASADIAPNAVNAATINGDVAGAGLIQNATTGALEVNEAAIADGTISSTDLTVTGGDNSVFKDVTLEITAGAVGTTELAADAVTNSRLADDAVQTENILSEGNDQVLVTNAAGDVEWIDKATLVPATTVSNTSAVNTLATTVDGVTGAGVTIINSNDLSLNTSNELVSTVNGEASSVIDLSPYINTDTQDISSSVITPNETVRVALVDGGTTDVDIRDADSDPTNELTQTGSGGPTGSPTNGTTYVDTDTGQMYVYEDTWKQVGGSATPAADIVTTLASSDNVTYTYTSENNTITSFDGTDDQDASEVSYDDATSSIGAANVQEAIEALASGSTDDQALSLATGNILTLEDGGTVNLTPFLDNTDDQEITAFSLDNTSNVLTLTLEDGGTETVD